MVLAERPSACLENMNALMASEKRVDHLDRLNADGIASQLAPLSPRSLAPEVEAARTDKTPVGTSIARFLPIHQQQKFRVCQQFFRLSAN
jgi:hypothetical protein